MIEFLVLLARFIGPPTAELEHWLGHAVGINGGGGGRWSPNWTEYGWPES